MKLPISNLEMSFPMMTTADSSVSPFNGTGASPVDDSIIRTVPSTESPLNVYENIQNQGLMGPVGPINLQGRSGIDYNENIMIQVNSLRSKVNRIESLLVELTKKVDNYHKEEFKFPD